MNKLAVNSIDQTETTIVAAKRMRCLVVHDDLELRLRLASLVRRAVPTFDADCISSASFDGLPAERIAEWHQYAVPQSNSASRRRDQTRSHEFPRDPEWTR